MSYTDLVLGALFPKGVMAPPSDLAALAQYIDYEALQNVMIYHGQALEVDHSMLEMEDWMWAEHERRMARFHGGGLY